MASTHFCQDLADLLLAHLLRMALVVLEARAPGPVVVGFVCAVGTVLALCCIAQLVELLLGPPCHASLQQSGFAHGAES